MQDIDWDLIKRNLDRLTNESLNDIVELILEIQSNRAIKERLERNKGK